MPTTFDGLPPEIRRVLAKRELIRRGLAWGTLPKGEARDPARLTRAEAGRLRKLMCKLGPEPGDKCWDLSVLTDSELDDVEELRLKLDGHNKVCDAHGG